MPAREFARSRKTFKAYGISVNDTDPREKILVDLLKVENLEKMKTLDNKKLQNKIQNKLKTFNVLGFKL